VTAIKPDIQSRPLKVLLAARAVRGFPRQAAIEGRGGPPQAMALAQDLAQPRGAARFAAERESGRPG
jgi:hypothetical protein